MALPSNWKQRKSSLPDPQESGEPQGHQERGGTICIHSLAVAKEHQGMGLGTVLLKSYIQRIKDSKVADRLALLAHEHLISFYVGLGFTDMGPSSATFGGGNWNNLVRVTQSGMKRASC
jgi:GNAT superfamily N-acetyltransferase